jgi:hypothetical protein
LEPLKNGTGVCWLGPEVGTKPAPIRRKPSASAMSWAQRARTALLVAEAPNKVSQGSVKLGKPCEPPPNRSLMVGARKPSAQVPRTNSDPIGFQVKPNLLLMVSPKVS